MAHQDWNELRERLLRGDAEAETDLYRHLSALPFLGTQPGDRTDVLQEVAGRVLVRFGGDAGRRRLRDVEDLRAFCLRVAINHARTRVRRLVTQKAGWLSPDLLASLVEPGENPPDARLLQRELREELLQGLRALNPQQIRILKMAWIEGLGVPQITQRLRDEGHSFTRRAVEAQLKRGREKLRRGLRARGILPEPRSRG